MHSANPALRGVGLFLCSDLSIRFFNTWTDQLVTIEYEGNICYNSLENENREIKERLWKLVLGHL